MTMTAVATLHVAVADVLYILRLLSPSLVFLSALLLIPAKPPPPPPPPSPSPITSVVVATHVPRRSLIVSLLTLISLTYLLDGLTFVIFAVLHKSWLPSAIDIASVIGLVAFSGLAALGPWKEANGVPFWSRKRVRWAIVICSLLEASIVVLTGVELKKAYHLPGPPTDQQPPTIYRVIHFAISITRILMLAVLVPALAFPRVVYTPINPDDDLAPANVTESSALLTTQVQPSTSAGLSPLSGSEQRKYGTFQEQGRGLSRTTSRSTTPTSSTPNKASLKGDNKRDVSYEPSWEEYFRRISRIMPYLWPSRSRPLQLIALLCFLLLLIGRILVAALPLTLGKLVEALESGTSPWIYLIIFITLKFLQDGGGLDALRDTLWFPVTQYSEREMSQLSLDHVLNLSFSWHLRRRTGEVLRTLDRGAAVIHCCEMLLFDALPVLIDIIIALVVFAVIFETTLALLMLVIFFTYVTASVTFAKTVTRIKRRVIDSDVTVRSIYTDSLLNYETIKYFCGEELEGARYAEAIRDYQDWERKRFLTARSLSLAQNMIITVGLLLGCLIVARRIVNGTSKPSEFVIFIFYWAQLYRPLVGLASLYKSINNILVDTERLLTLLCEPTEVNDAPNASELVVRDGEIEFENVSFSYDDHRQALSSVSFKVPKGNSVALVGESGAGKSTILRLLYRFYDLKEGQGRILIDGQDIKEVTQASLRRAIGVVPQDPILFNASIAYNLGYGKPGASHWELEQAAQAAQMHERILSFPDGYETKVGERGVRLSGGEKQRLAIARTMLKNPPILFLDEATSSLDTSTEKDIHNALQNLQEGRSSLSIAHRLSTIASADLILVLKEGQIVEEGTHEELLARDGAFAAMWADQKLASEGGALASSEAGPAGKEGAGNSVDDTVSVVPVVDPSASGAVHTGGLATEGETPQVPPPTGDVGYDVAGADSKTAPVAFPTMRPGDDGSQKTPSIRTPGTSPPQSLPPPTPAVTFGSEVNTPARSSTPDPEARIKRTPTQNLQRMARRISLSRKDGSFSLPRIPVFGRKEGSQGETSSLRGEASSGRSQSPAPAASAESDKKQQRKAKKRMSMG